MGNTVNGQKRKILHLSIPRENVEMEKSQQKKSQNLQAPGPVMMPRSDRFSGHGSQDHSLHVAGYQSQRLTGWNPEQ